MVEKKDGISRRDFLGLFIGGVTVSEIALTGIGEPSAPPVLEPRMESLEADQLNYKSVAFLQDRHNHRRRSHYGILNVHHLCC